MIATWRFELLLCCLLHQRANSGSRKGSGRAGSANMPGTGGSRNNSAGSGEYQPVRQLYAFLPSSAFLNCLHQFLSQSCSKLKAASRKRLTGYTMNPCRWVFFISLNDSVLAFLGPGFLLLFTQGEFSFHGIKDRLSSAFSSRMDLR